MQERLNSTKSLDELRGRESGLQQEKELLREVTEAEESSPSDKENAQEREAKNRRGARAFPNSYRGKRRGAASRGKGQRDLQKLKYGVTLTAIFLAAGVTIGVVISTVTNTLKATGKALGSGLKDIGAKLGSLLPGLIGSIMSFLFKTAGQAIGYLAEHTWLLIFAVVVFVVEEYFKKRC